MIPPALEKQSAPFLNMKEMTKSRKHQAECFTYSYVNQNSLTPPLPPWTRAPNGVWEGYTQALRAACLSTKKIRLFNTSQHAPLPDSKLRSFKSDPRLKNTTSAHESVVGDESKGMSAYPSPNPSFCPKYEVSVNVGLREG